MKKALKYEKELDSEIKKYIENIFSKDKNKGKQIKIKRYKRSGYKVKPSTVRKHRKAGYKVKGHDVASHFRTKRSKKR